MPMALHNMHTIHPHVSGTLNETPFWLTQSRVGALAAQTWGVLFFCLLSRIRG